MNKCPRCKLPQEGLYKCQYCGYDLTKDKKRRIKTIRQKLGDIIGSFNKDQIFASNKKSKILSINNATKRLQLKDKGGTRSGTDRRKLRYMIYIPENRSGWDRRKRVDRRGRVAKKRWPERRFSLNHLKPNPRQTQSHIHNAILI